jgi:hypothetical protein
MSHLLSDRIHPIRATSVSLYKAPKDAERRIDGAPQGGLPA